MTTLAADKARTYEIGDINALPVVAADTIHEGAAVGDDGAGYARPLVAGDAFRGFADSKVDNAIGAAGDRRVTVKTQGLIQLAVAGLTVADVGKPVYASDDDTFTLTAAGNSHIGRVHRWVAAGVGIVAFSAAGSALGAVTALTNNSGGAVSDTIGAIGAAYSQTEVANAIASLTAKVNALSAQTK